MFSAHSAELRTTSAEREELRGLLVATKATAHASMRYWVVQQHDEFTIHHQAERPDTKPVDGERLKMSHGSYATREDAQKRVDAMVKRTLRHMVGKER